MHLCVYLRVFAFLTTIQILIFLTHFKFTSLLKDTKVNDTKHTAKLINNILSFLYFFFVAMLKAMQDTFLKSYENS